MQAPHPIGEPDRLGVMIGGNEYDVVEERRLIRHKCGHECYWEFMPNVDVDRFAKEACRANCPACGGETGVMQTPQEWPCHVRFAGVAKWVHCHEPWDACADVEEAFRLGLATPEGPQRAHEMRARQELRRKALISVMGGKKHRRWT